MCHLRFSTVAMQGLQAPHFECEPMSSTAIESEQVAFTLVSASVAGRQRACCIAPGPRAWHKVTVPAKLSPL
jgi:hypothetical protein